MDPKECAALLKTNAQRVSALVDGIGDEQARWKPNAETWSLLEVINHLYDEEMLDFRVRLDHILFKPDQAFPPIDPPGWVTKHAYNQRDLAPSLQGYLDQRAKSLAWLATLQVVDWDTIHSAAEWAIAGNVLTSWVAHDLLHMRQLVELHWAWMSRQVAPYETDYAGDW